ncbi:HAD-IA family hydrolase [Tenggerimyces flavus]|uniref:HAD-IA family hydrolase n=1 Tax=Tenggerimyces flavus TaxID=1708749 RepID=A0ABV7YLT0_9ACTN|nr:HAD-IA family hydrolase [Tenggerimyces flavus]MBM7787503.1 sugar-phosphatase [Tenggerimyces flavus]
MTAERTEFHVDAVLLDLDGTLIDSTPIIVRSWSRWAEEFGVTTAQFEALGSLHGRTSGAIVRALVPPDRVAAGERRIDELETTDVDGLVPLPGVTAFLAKIPAGRWAIVTSGNDAIAGVRTKAAGLEPTVLITADDVTYGKPHPEPFLLGAERLGVAPERCLVIEDAPAGLEAARKAGMRTIAVTTSHRAADLDADLVVSGIHELDLHVSGGPLIVRAAGAASSED